MESLSPMYVKQNDNNAKPMTSNNHIQHSYKIIGQSIFIPDWRQSKMLLTTDKCESMLARNSVFNCHLSPI